MFVAAGMDGRRPQGPARMSRDILPPTTYSVVHWTTRMLFEIVALVPSVLAEPAGRRPL